MKLKGEEARTIVYGDHEDWEEVKPMEQRLRFILDYQHGYFSVAELCNRFGISRTTGYKWINRYQTSGIPDAIFDLSRRPHHSPTQTPDEIVQAILKMRDKHPFWGPRKLLHLVAKKHPDWILPAESTAALILKRNGYIKPRRKRTKRHHPGSQARDEPVGFHCLHDRPSLCHMRQDAH